MAHRKRIPRDNFDLAAATAGSAFAESPRAFTRLQKIKSSKYPLTFLAAQILEQAMDGVNLRRSQITIPMGYSDRTIDRMITALASWGHIEVRDHDSSNDPLVALSPRLRKRVESIPTVDTLSPSIHDDSLEDWIGHIRARIASARHHQLRITDLTAEVPTDKLIYTSRKRIAIYGAEHVIPYISARRKTLTILGRLLRWPTRNRQEERANIANIGTGIDSATSDVNHILNLLGPPPESLRSRNAPTPRLPVGVF